MTTAKKSYKDYLASVKRKASWVNNNRKKMIAILVVAFLAVIILYSRGQQLYDCTMAKYDLKRETNFRLLTGKCTVTGKDGNQVYINQIRGIGEEAL